MLECCGKGVEALPRFDQRALEREWDEIRELAEGFVEWAPAPEDAVKHLCSAPARLGHVDMRIGAVGDKGRGLLHHSLGHVGVEIEARDDRHVRVHECAHASQKLALPVFEMFRHHGTMEIEIDRIDGQGRCKIADQHCRDALIGVARDVGRRLRVPPDERDEFVSHGAGGVDESGDGNVDFPRLFRRAARRASDRASRWRERNPRSAPWSARTYWSRAESRRRRSAPSNPPLLAPSRAGA